MRSIITPILIFLSLSLPALASPTTSTPLKQATRDSIVSRAQNPLRRQNTASCLACSTCCSGFCSMSGQTNHAVYADTGVPPNVVHLSGPVTQSSLETCIRSCCNLQTCDTATYDPISKECNTYDLASSGGPQYVSDPGVQLVANKVTCAGNTVKGGSRTCCDAPVRL
ncbi:uncharacterized protein MKK02DRAFT_41769 [Dioszegia hungarica]|uniref:Apple domain-containing protein n=1 Tax=Dioszegia hungarica TaxID=4972 RepID=A0AA38LYA8_9TREE|nr:uncharacterized protein MKK02DRAFT_41769 [Dioszegia hungarica]KAI9638744.1 hypothetical protein MKK02DRAFT_41769 [Dioszegia hungarica]